MDCENAPWKNTWLHENGYEFVENGFDVDPPRENIPARFRAKGSNIRVRVDRVKTAFAMSGDSLAYTAVNKDGEEYKGGQGGGCTFIGHPGLCVAKCERLEQQRLALAPAPALAPAISYSVFSNAQVSGGTFSFSVGPGAPTAAPPLGTPVEGMPTAAPVPAAPMPTAPMPTAAGAMGAAGAVQTPAATEKPSVDEMLRAEDAAFEARAARAEAQAEAEARARAAAEAHAASEARAAAEAKAKAEAEAEARVAADARADAAFACAADETRIAADANARAAAADAIAANANARADASDALAARAADEARADAQAAADVIANARAAADAIAAEVATATEAANAAAQAARADAIAAEARGVEQIRIAEQACAVAVQRAVDAEAARRASSEAKLRTIAEHESTLAASQQEAADAKRAYEKLFEESSELEGTISKLKIDQLVEGDANEEKILKLEHEKEQKAAEIDRAMATVANLHTRVRVLKAERDEAVRRASVIEGVLAESDCEPTRVGKKEKKGKQGKKGDQATATAAATSTSAAAAVTASATAVATDVPAVDANVTAATVPKGASPEDVAEPTTGFDGAVAEPPVLTSPVPYAPATPSTAAGPEGTSATDVPGPSATPRDSVDTRSSSLESTQSMGMAGNFLHDLDHPKNN